VPGKAFSARDRFGCQRGAGAEAGKVERTMSAVNSSPTTIRDFACDWCGSASIAPPQRLSDSDVVRCQHCKKALMTWRVYRLLGAADTQPPQAPSKVDERRIPYRETRE
jgi:hypothetical protein